MINQNTGDVFVDYDFIGKCFEICNKNSVCTLNNDKLDCPYSLNCGTALARRYIICKCYDYDDTSITYYGYDKVSSRGIMIVEFFPNFCAERENDGYTVKGDGRFADYYHRGRDMFFFDASFIMSNNLRGIARVFD